MICVFAILCVILCIPGNSEKYNKKQYHDVIKKYAALGSQHKKQPTEDELIANANSISDYKSLALKGYTKAYYPLAQLYFLNGKYSDAKYWAKKSIEVNKNTEKARNMLEKIKKKMSYIETMKNLKSLHDYSEKNHFLFPVD